MERVEQVVGMGVAARVVARAAAPAVDPRQSGRSHTCPG